MPDSSKSLDTWQSRLEKAEQILRITNQLAQQKSVKIYLHGLSFAACSATEFMQKFHYFVRYHKVSLQQALGALQTLMDVPLAGSGVAFDLIRLIHLLYPDKKSGKSSVVDLQQKLVQVTENQWNSSAPRPVVLFGFGRIGRLLARILVAQSRNDAFYLAAIVVRGQGEQDLLKRMRLLEQDSVHGRLDGLVEVGADQKSLVINGQSVALIYADHPSKVDYRAYGIEQALIVDNTGKWRDAEGLGLHLQAQGASQVLLTAPAKGDVPNIVFGLNQQKFAKNTPLISAASCTTNAICPVLSVIDQAFGLQYGHVETVHAYTNDQNLLDNYHKADRRGRSAALNMVMTETGAAKAVAKVLPHIGSKLTGNAIRVPVANVSLAILQLELATAVSKEQVNQVIKQAVMDLQLNGQLGFSENPDAVSTDFTGTHYAAVVDLKATIVSSSVSNSNADTAGGSKQGKHVLLYVWYDNEYGYSVQVARLIRYLSC